jgi:hypothetical protein
MNVEWTGDRRERRKAVDVDMSLVTMAGRVRSAKVVRGTMGSGLKEISERMKMSVTDQDY